MLTLLAMHIVKILDNDNISPDNYNLSYNSEEQKFKTLIQGPS